MLGFYLHSKTGQEGGKKSETERMMMFGNPQQQGSRGDGLGPTYAPHPDPPSDGLWVSLLGGKTRIQLRRCITMESGRRALRRGSARPPRTTWGVLWNIDVGIFLSLVEGGG